MEKKKFNVLIWDFNKDNIEHYDVLPHFRRCYEKRVVDHKATVKKAWWKKAGDEEKAEYLKFFFIPKTFDDFKTFVEEESRYQFWARCEYEMICSGWPVQKKEYKLDVHEQIMMNIDVVAEILWKELGEKTEE